MLVDPKMVEFSLYSKLERHYLAKLPDENEAIITDPMKVVATLNSPVCGDGQSLRIAQGCQRAHNKGV